MSERKDVTPNQPQTPAQPGDQPLARGPVEYLLPRVDVYEDQTGITLTADLPGVSRERLSLEVNQNLLVIEGETLLDAPTNLQALYAEVHNPRYRRRFTLSSELDTEAVEATLRDGVLTLRLPKKAVHQPRKIEVQTA